MKRLTERLENGVINVKYASQHESAIHRLVTIEDILGDEYDLDRLRELVQADREEKCVILELKEGDPVYELYYLVKGVENPEMELKVRVVGFEKSMTGQLGKSVFISYEDAEKAVEMEKNGND